MPRSLLLLLTFLAATSLPAQIANRPPAPLWLSGTSLEKTFTPPGQLLMAILLVASDAETTLSLNGQSIATLPPSPTATSLDLTRHLIDGPNTLSLRSSGKVAAILNPALPIPPPSNFLKKNRLTPVTKSEKN